MLRKQPLAAASFVYIVIIAIVAVLGYLITADDSPQANYQYPTLALKEIGFETLLLAVPLEADKPTRSWVYKMLAGQPSQYKYHPYSRLIEKKDSFYIYDEIAKDSSSIEAVAGSFKTRRIFLLGTDRYGRCVLSRLMIGARVSLGVGLIAVIISLLIGLPIGIAGGYFGGRVDDVVMLLINVVWSVPTLLLVFAIVLALGRHPANVFVAVGLTMWVDIARLVRGQTIGLKNTAFIEAAQSMGFGTVRIFVKHLLPNLVGPLLVIAAANFAMAILIEAGLSYLGFGVPPPQPSWGNMLNENYGFAISGHWHVALVPTLAIMSLVLAFNLLGSGLRDTVDVKEE